MEHLSDEQTFWTMFAIVEGCFAVLKGFQLPSDWALMQTLLPVCVERMVHREASGQAALGVMN